MPQLNAAELKPGFKTQSHENDDFNYQFSFEFSGAFDAGYRKDAFLDGHYNNSLVCGIGAGSGALPEKTD